MIPDFEKERRKFPRINLPIDIVCVFNDKPPEVYKSRMVNISRGGVRISDDHYYEDSTLIVVIVKLPGDALPAVATAKQVWAKRISGSVVEKGMEFIKISERVIQKLLDYALLSKDKGSA
ncbi:MAG: PilZ domain-containing protein [Candidatus Omnitrophota bacterium]